MIKLILNRSSVSMSDDTRDHAKEFSLNEESSVNAFREIIKQYDDIPDGFDKWVLCSKNGEDLLIYTSDTREIKYLVSPDTQMKNYCVEYLGELWCELWLRRLSIN